MAGAEANTPSDPWAAWGDPQQGAAPPTEAAPLPDPPQEQGDQTVGDVPEHGADSAEWPGDDWNGGTSTNWWSTDEQWTSDRWRWDRWQVRDDSYGRWEWRHDCGTESTRDSDHGSNGGRWQDRRVSSADDDQWTRGSWQQSTEHHQNLSYNDTGDTKRATLSERMAVPSFSAAATSVQVPDRMFGRSMLGSRLPELLNTNRPYFFTNTYRAAPGSKVRSCA